MSIQASLESGSHAEAYIINTWPRTGLAETSAAGDRIIASLVSDGDGWRLHWIDENESRCGFGDPLDALRSALDELRPEFPEAGAIGYVSYEMGSRHLDLSPRSTPTRDRWRIPAIQFHIFAGLTHPTPRSLRLSDASHRTFTRRELDQLFEQPEVRRLVTRAKYKADVDQIKELIGQGEIYQANYTQVFDLMTASPPKENARRLQSQVMAPYAGYLSFDVCEVRTREGVAKRYPPMAIMSVSPERFWRKRGNVVDSRPIKGTIARGATAHEERVRRRQLLASGKDRAELLMITDLVRNDLGQVADIGGVRTESLVRIRPTPSVWHLESTVSARLSPELSWVDVMKALHPAGSITGTPKRRATEILAKLEPVDRGPYCGAIGWVDAAGNADFAVGIRTCLQIGDRIRIHGGGGIVADSEPESEYYESLIKIAPLLEALSESNAAATLLPALPTEPAHA